ncbi:hypothetical protein BZA77DRAFT_355665 [Pyronema omphalodes]|nr:hypothetical protein BZA77DRAFT_355665 [Pyronema omphalodes]
MVTTLPSYDPLPTLAGTIKPGIPEANNTDNTDNADHNANESESTLVAQATRQLLNFNEIIQKLQATKETTESALKEENRRLVNEISNLTAELSSMREQRDSARQQLEKAQKRYEVEITELGEQNSKLQNVMRRLEQYGSFGNVVELMRKYEEMEENMTEEEKKLLEYHEEMEKSEEDWNGVGVQLTENGRNIKKQMNRCDEIEERLDGSEKKLREQEEKLQEVREGLVGVNMKLNELDLAVLPEKPHEAGMVEISKGYPSFVPGQFIYVERSRISQFLVIFP